MAHFSILWFDFMGLSVCSFVSKMRKGLASHNYVQLGFLFLDFVSEIQIILLEKEYSIINLHMKYEDVCTYELW